ncbi:hypothetical protein PG989_005716 [Apiospora arundinis]
MAPTSSTRIYVLANLGHHLRHDSPGVERTGRPQCHAIFRRHQVRLGLFERVGVSLGDRPDRFVHQLESKLECFDALGRHGGSLPALGEEAITVQPIFIRCSLRVVGGFSLGHDPSGLEHLLRGDVQEVTDPHAELDISGPLIPVLQLLGFQLLPGLRFFETAVRHYVPNLFAVLFHVVAAAAAATDGEALFFPRRRLLRPQPVAYLGPLFPFLALLLDPAA